jgi:ribosomal protein L11 methyltransferase
VRRVSFRVPSDEKEDLLDALMPLLPAGVHERAAADGEVELATVVPVAPDRAVLEAAAGGPLAGWRDEPVPADWRARRARFGGGSFRVGGRLVVRSPWDPPPGDGVLDLVLERAGGGFGSGSHATTRMCLALLLELEPSGGAADLGCGLGTLAIAAARLGWTPVVGLDRMDGAVAAARANGARNGVDVEWRLADLETAPIPAAPLLLVNAPPSVHARVAAALGEAASAPPQVHARVAAALRKAPGSPPVGALPRVAAELREAAGAPPAAASSRVGDSSPAAPRVRHVIASGLVPGELGAALDAYETAGLALAARLEQDGWAAALLERRGG